MWSSSGTHICIKETNPINTQIDDSEILCPGCKSVIRVKFNKTSRGIENTCVILTEQELYDSFYN